MFTILIVLFGIIISAKNFFRKDYYEKRNLNVIRFGHLIFTLVSTFIVSFISISLWIYSPFVGVEVQRQDVIVPIISLKNSESSTAKFILGNGQLNATEYYFVYAKHPDNRIERIQIRVQDAFLIESTNRSPQLIWQVVKTKPSKWFHIWPLVKKTTYTKIDIIVPPNTVIQKFNAF